MKASEFFARERAINPEFARIEAERAFVEDLADEVLRRRLALGLTQAELARAASTTQAMISEIESANCNPTASTIAKIFAALDPHARVAFQTIEVPKAVVYFEYQPSAYQSLYGVGRVAEQQVPPVFYPVGVTSSAFAPELSGDLTVEIPAAEKPAANNNFSLAA